MVPADDLDAILTFIWDELTRAASDGDSGTSSVWPCTSTCWGCFVSWLDTFWRIFAP